jgi:ParB family chromosome partitioning protein
VAKKLSGLGRGIDAIFLENTPEESAPAGGTTTLRLSQMEPKGNQPRKYFDTEALAQLAESVSAHGVLQPILVRAVGDDRYQIIAGERRFRASKMAGLSEVPVIILDTTEEQTAQIALIENIQREDLNPIEEAAAYRSGQSGKVFNMTINTTSLSTADMDMLVEYMNGKLGEALL